MQAPEPRQCWVLRPGSPATARLAGAAQPPRAPRSGVPPPQGKDACRLGPPPWSGAQHGPPGRLVGGADAQEGGSLLAPRTPDRGPRATRCGALPSGLALTLPWAGALAPALPLQHSDLMMRGAPPSPDLEQSWAHRQETGPGGALRSAARGALPAAAARPPASASPPGTEPASRPPPSAPPRRLPVAEPLGPVGRACLQLRLLKGGRDPRPASPPAGSVVGPRPGTRTWRRACRQR